MINLHESMELYQDFLFILSIVKYFLNSHIGFGKSKPENIDRKRKHPHTRTRHNVKTGGKQIL